MTSPVKIQCPSCQGTLKLPSRSAAGKRVRCPKCDHAFVVELPEEEADEFADFGAADEDYDDEFSAPTRRPEHRSKPAKRKSKKAGAWKLPVMIGGGVAAVLLAVGLIFWLTGSAGATAGGKVDMTWLPPDSEAVVSIRAGEILRMPSIQQLLAAPDAQQTVAELKRELGLGEAESLEEIESAVYAVSGLSSQLQQGFGGLARGPQPLQNETGVGVIRKRSPWDVGALKAAGREATHEGKTYLVTTLGGVEMASYFPDERTRVMAKEAYLKEVLSRGGGSSSLAQFEFVDFGRDLVFAVVPKDASPLRQQLEMAKMMTATMPEAADLVEPMAEGFQGFSFGLNVSGEMDMLAQVNFAERGQASRFSGGVEVMLGKAREQMGMMKAMMPPDQARMAEEVMDTLEADSSGTTASVAMTFPQSARQQMEQAIKEGVLKGRGAAQVAQSHNNLRQIGLAMHNYHDTMSQFPVTKGNPSYRGPDGRPKLSWRVHLLPFLEQQALYDQFHLDEPWDSPHNRALVPQMPAVFQSPGGAPGTTRYLGIAGPGGVFENGGGARLSDIKDGASSTVMVLEVPTDRAVTWTQPDDFVFDPGNPFAGLIVLPPGLNALFCDGAVKSISPATPPETVRNLFQHSDGNPVDFF